MGAFLSGLMKSRFGTLSARTPQALTTQALSLIQQIYSATRPTPDIQAGDTSPWRPPQWDGVLATLTMSVTDAQGQATLYVFDGAIRVQHEENTVITLNPVQNGAPIADHAYTVPPRVTAELMMSDAMQAYSASAWGGGPSKSVSAYQVLVKLQESKTVVQIATRLRQYDKMLIANVRAEETKETRFGSRFTVTFQKILTASISTSSTATPDSDIPQVTGQTQGGQVQTSPVPAQVASQNAMPYLPLTPGSSVAGAGSWSSLSSGSMGLVLP